MRNSEFWLSVETEANRARMKPRIGALRVALLFGTMAVAMALLLPPMVGAGGPRMAAYTMSGIDSITTGSIQPNQGPRRYTIRRSILQEPGTVCILDSSGSLQGQC